MKRSAALCGIALALGATILMPGAGAQAATPIATCQTIGQPGSYVLVNNLTATGDCLVISAGTDFVTIDLAGFSISGNGTGTGIITVVSPPSSGISPHRGIAVRNGSISNFRNGIDLDFAEGSLVEGLRVSGNTSDFGIHAFGIARENTVVNNRSFGILVFGTVTGNYAAGNDIGISGGRTVSGNTALRNRIGFSVADSTLIGNTATDNTDVGLDVNCPSNLTDNTALNNGKNLVLNGNGCHNEDNVAP